jgi:acetoacetyl-CoA synthetase
MQPSIGSPSPACIAARHLTGLAAFTHAHPGGNAVLNDNDGIAIVGCAAAVLKSGGVRTGSAKIYRQVARLTGVPESPAIGRHRQNDARVVPFVRPRPAAALDGARLERIRNPIGAGTSPRHVPAKAIAAPHVPRTIGGSIVEPAVRNPVHGLPVRNTDALVHLEALARRRDLPEPATE